MADLPAKLGALRFDEKPGVDDVTFGVTPGVANLLSRQREHQPRLQLDASGGDGLHFGADATGQLL